MALKVETETRVSGDKEFTLTEGQKINIDIAGVEDADLTYTVPQGKTLTIRVNMHGDQTDA